MTKDNPGHYPESYPPTMNLFGPKTVDVVINKDSKTLWIIVDEKCRLRISKIDSLHIYRRDFHND